MKRTFLLTAGWILATGALYLSVLFLDVYWNLLQWKPRLDGMAGGILVIGAVAIVALWALARQDNGRLAQTISLPACASLLAVAVYAWPAEPLSNDLLGREMVSPIWYRSGRLLLMGLPCVFWVVAFRRRKKAARTAKPAP